MSEGLAVVIDSAGDLEVFASIEDMALLEWDDVVDGEYRAWTATGQRVQLLASPPPETKVFARVDSVSEPDILREALLNFIRRDRPAGWDSLDLTAARITDLLSLLPVRSIRRESMATRLRKWVAQRRTDD